MAQTATVQIQMPEMGESVTEGIVLEWHVAEGDFVNEGDTVVEVSTDKVDAEVPAPTAGVITKLIASVDDEVPVGAPLGGDGAGRGRRRGFDARQGLARRRSLRAADELRSALPRHPTDRLNSATGPRSATIPKTCAPLRSLGALPRSMGWISAGSLGAGRGRRSPRTT